MDKPFRVGSVSMNYPRDPKAPASETVNGGCVSLPFMEDWDVSQPGRQAFTDEEIFNNPQKRHMARELNPEIDPRSPGLSEIRRLETLSPEVAREQIAASLKTDGFKSFVNNPGKSRDHRAVAVMPDELKAVFGTSTPIVRLSSYTAVKQRARRHGQKFRTSDYARVQSMLDKGLVFQENERNFIVFADNRKAVIKRTSDGSEIYLQTLHRSKKAQMENTARKMKLVKKQR